MTTTRLQRVVLRERFVWDATFYLTVGWIIFGALPVVAILVLSLVFGNYPTDDNPTPEGFPAFTPPWFATYPLVGLQIIATAVAIPLPLRGLRGQTRSVLLIQSGFVAASTMLIGAFTAARHGTLFGLEWLTILSLLAIAALLLRIVAGWLRLLPLSWREYVAEDDAIVQARDVGRGVRLRPWDGLHGVVEKLRRH